MSLQEVEQQNHFRTSYRFDANGEVHCYFHLGLVEHGLSLESITELRDNLSEIIVAVNMDNQEVE